MDKSVDLADVIRNGSSCASERAVSEFRNINPVNACYPGPTYDSLASCPRHLDMPLQCSKLFRRSHSRRINCVSISPCSRYVATGSHELAVWDLGDMTKAACIVPIDELILCLSWIESSVAGWTLACGLHNGVLLTLSFKKARLLSSFILHD